MIRKSLTLHSWLSAVSGLALVLVLQSTAPTAVAAEEPVSVFSGVIQDWFVDFDPVTGNCIMSSDGVDVRIGTKSCVSLLLDIEIDRLNPPVSLPGGSGYSFAIIPAAIPGGLIVDDGEGGWAEFHLNLDNFYVLSGSAGMIDVLIGVDDITLLEDQSDVYDFSAFARGGDFVATLQVAGTTSLLDILLDGEPLTDGSLTSGSFSAAANPPADGCTRTIGYWMNHEEDWPVMSLMLGNEQYDQGELLELLRMPVRGDASVILAKQLIAAMLNVESGAQCVDAVNALESANEWLAGFDGKLPYRVKPRTEEGGMAEDLGSYLDSYNNGELMGCPMHCDEMEEEEDD